MFTVGIFSTHLPYIAFVCFYAFIFLTGIPKVSAGKLNGDKKIVQSSIIVYADIQPVDYSNHPFTYFYNFNSIQSADLKLFSYKKTIFIFTPNEQIRKNCFYFHRFSRPPPFV
jgi:hypothetical protein